MSQTVHIPVTEAGPSVRDVLLRDARTIPADTPVAEVRATFENPRVKLLLVADGERFLGTLAPADVPDGADGTIAPLVRGDAPRLAPDDPVSVALELVAATQLDRIPVVDAGERVLGLVAFNRRHSTFCASP